MDKIQKMGNEQKMEKIKKPKKKRCFQCNKKVGFMELKCKCSDNIYCSNCIQSEQHNCTFNYKEESKNKLMKSLVKVAPEKIIRI